LWKPLFYEKDEKKRCHVGKKNKKNERDVQEKPSKRGIHLLFEKGYRGGPFKEERGESFLRQEEKEERAGKLENRVLSLQCRAKGKK